MNLARRARAQNIPILIRLIRIQRTSRNAEPKVGSEFSVVSCLRRSRVIARVLIFRGFDHQHGSAFRISIELLNLRRELDIGKDHCSREEFNLFSAPGKKCSFIIYIDIMDLFIMT